MSLKSRSTVNAHDFFTFFSKMGARQGLAQTQIAAYDHAQRSAPPIDLVWLTWSWMTIAAYDHAQRSAPPIDLVWLTWSWIKLESQRLGSAPSRFSDPFTRWSAPQLRHARRDPFLNEMIELLPQRANRDWGNRKRTCARARAGGHGRQRTPSSST